MSSTFPIILVDNNVTNIVINIYCLRFVNKIVMFYYPHMWDFIMICFMWSMFLFWSWMFDDDLHVCVIFVGRGRWHDEGILEGKTMKFSTIPSPHHNACAFKLSGNSNQTRAMVDQLLHDQVAECPCKATACSLNCLRCI